MSVDLIDFTDVQTGGGFLAAGTYAARVESVERREGNRGPYYAWTFVSAEPETAGMKATLMTSLSHEALWKLKETLEGLGMKVEGKLKLDTEKFIGRMGTVVVVNEPYEGSDGQMRNSHKVQRLLPYVRPLTASTESETKAAVPADMARHHDGPTGDEGAPAAPPDDFGDITFGDDDEIPF